MYSQNGDLRYLDFDYKKSKLLFFGLICFFLFEYIRITAFIPVLGLLKVNVLIPLGVFFFSLFLQESINNSEILKSSTAKLLGFFVFLLAISIFTSDVTFFAWNLFRAALGYLFIYFALRKLVISEPRISWLFFTLVIIHIIVALMSPDVILHPETRSYLNNAAFLGDGNDYALSVCIVIPFAIYLVQVQERFMRKCFLLLILLVLIFCVVGTSSRGATLALAAILGYQWLKSRNKIWGIVLLAMVGVFILAYAPPQYFERIESIKDYRTEGSAQGRLSAWGSAIEMANDNPLTGVGAGHFSVKFGLEYRPKGIGRTEMPWMTAHSIYFLALGELGYPGLLFLIAILGLNIRDNAKLIRDFRRLDTGEEERPIRLLIAANSSIVAYGVGGAFLSALYYPHLFVISGISGSIHYFCLHLYERLAHQEHHNCLADK